MARIIAGAENQRLTVKSKKLNAERERSRTSVVLRQMSIQTIIYHANCPDGFFAAAIAAAKYPEAELIACQYGKQQEDLIPQEGTLFVDFSPSTRLDEWREKGAVIYDHHEGAKDKVLQIGGNFSEEDSGALMVAKALGAPERVVQIAEHVSVRDTWKKDDPRWDAANDVSGAVIGLGIDYAKSLVENPPAVEEIRIVGKLLREKHLAAVRKVVSEGIPATTKDGCSALLIKGAAYSSDATLYSAASIVVAVEYIWEAGLGKTVFSMRGRDGKNVLCVAKNNNGGGHASAAGASVMGLREPREILEKIQSQNWDENFKF